MSIAADILRTYRTPRLVLEDRVHGSPREDRALAMLVAACVMIFVAQWPRLARESWLDPAIDLQARLAGALFAWGMVMPLAFYAIALAIFLGLRLMGRDVTAYQVRVSLFWALLASVPLWLFSGLVAGFAGPGATVSVLSALGLIAVVVFTRAGIGAARTEEHLP